MIELRPYQRAAIDALWDFWGRGGGNPLVEMATGTGKSVVIATLVRELIETYPDMRVLMLVHVRELVAQNFQALVRTWPQAPAGINSAGLGRRDRFSQVLFASIQSVQRDDCHSIGKRDIVLVDEAHLIPRAGDGMYQKLLGRLRDGVPDMRIAGFTATPYRLDSGRLDRGEGRLFDQIAYSYGIGRGIDDGYLSQLVSKATATALDTRGVARRGGEFVAGALEVAVDKDWITRAAVDEIVTFGADRRSWLVFCSGVQHAAHVAEEIRSRGVSCAAVTGETPSGERDRLIAAFKAGQIRCLTNAMVLTTGFDAPQVDLVAMLRPTLSTGLYVQIVGRGTRLADGKENCLILDFAGNVRRHGPVDAVEPGAGPKGGEGDGEAEVRAKECPECATLVALNARACPTCGHEWPVRDEPKHEATADAETAIISRGAPAWVAVDAVKYYRHEKYGSPPSMRVEYLAGMTVHREWVCFQHVGFARSKAESWWIRAIAGHGLMSPPRTTDEALSRLAELRCPAAIQVRPSGKYFEVVGRRYEQRERAA
ncbi:Putative DNA repair helicase RadD [Rhodoplanes serenus]|uniref:DNA repair helicase RadD n=1 Tax=Rhodoplanes serenus TaxID=200615 RepID=A0A3S4BUT7_9BRAD|nr:DEAD/DEAH box helicase [Rhodoplanes serenus]VCU06599.1 Putative DNA repair helicase RadD [Rhodoplanes serenus]VCU07859.1 Putative DNA repair helicase RadD [Rhodoplanes serenus]